MPRRSDVEYTEIAIHKIAGILNFFPTEAGLRLRFINKALTEGICNEG